jgi:ATP-dependent DNA helicase PIF1
LAESLRKVDIIIIDEGPMLEKYNFECLDRSLRDVADPDKVFGGKLVLVCGDFRQLLPIIPRGNRARVVSSTLKRSKLWDDDVMILSLTKNMRVQKMINKHPGDQEFHQELKEHERWLLDLGEGKLPSLAEVPITGESVIEIPQSMARDNREDVIGEIFGDLRHHIGDKQYLKSRMLLAADNEIVNETNLELVKKLPGELHTFKSVDSAVDDEGGSLFPAEFLNTQNPSGIAEHELCLKVNAVVILLRNMNIPAGHCNGTRYIVKAIGKYRLVLEKLDADPDDKDKILLLPRIPMISNEASTAFKLKRLQFPIKLAFAVTFNRAQGQSVEEKCGILLPKKIWTHGQIYVAFSRCGNPRSIFVWADQSDLLEKCHLPEGKKCMTNVVYKEVL